MTQHHEHEKKDHVSAFDPDFDAVAPSDSGIPASAPGKAMTVSFTVTPLKLVLAGFVAGLIVMGIPAAFFAAKAGGPAALAGGFGGGNNQPVAPTPSQPGAPAKPEVGNLKAVSKDDHIRGDRNAKVMLVEYSDMECPFCKRYHPTVKQTVEQYKGKVAWVYRHFPLSFHANAQKQAEATECAADVGGNDKFWEYLDKIFERTTAGGTGFALDQLVPLAKELGIDEGKFKSCLDGGKFTAKVQKDLQEGQEAGVDGTPGTILVRNDGKKVLVPGAVPDTELKSEIDALLK